MTEPIYTYDIPTLNAIIHSTTLDKLSGPQASTPEGQAYNSAMDKVIDWCEHCLYHELNKVYDFTDWVIAATRSKLGKPTAFWNDESGNGIYFLVGKYEVYIPYLSGSYPGEPYPRYALHEPYAIPIDWVVVRTPDSLRKVLDF